MQKSRPIQVKATVLEAVSNTQFRVELANGARMTGTLSGEMRMKLIRILPGDRVLLECTPFDLSKGRIVLKEGH